MKRPNANAAWFTHFPDGKKLTQKVFIDGDDVWIKSLGLNGYVGGFFRVSRKDARLLAKRINQCLDATTKK